MQVIIAFKISGTLVIYNAISRNLHFADNAVAFAVPVAAVAALQVITVHRRR